MEAEMRSTLIGISALALIANPAQAARKSIDPYIEVGQVITADLNGDSDVLTYSTIAAGVDATVQTSRVEAQISYRYERRIAWDDNIADDDIHSGLARVNVQAVPGVVNIEAGALATRARSGIGGGFPGQTAGNVDSLTQVYSVYAGPTLTTNVGELQVGASYRAGYTKVESKDGILAPDGIDRIDSYDDSVVQSATANVGMAPGGSLPFGWAVSGGWEREDAGQLDQRFESKYVRGDVTVPVSPTLALVGGIGYEDIEAAQRAPLLDEDDIPVIDGQGRFVTDPNSPRLQYYDQDGLIWDAGVLWRPSRRTELEVRVGRRYGDMTYTGRFSYQMSGVTALQITAYDSVSSFGQQLNDNLSLLPTAFQVDRNPLSGNIGGGCVFGGRGTGGQSAGGCLNDVFQSISTANFRARGINGVISTQRGPWSGGVGLGYSQRRFIAPDFGGTFTVDGTKDESIFAQAYVARQLTPNSGIDANVYADWYNSGLAGAPDVVSTGLTGSYNHTFGRLAATVSAGVYGLDPEGLEAQYNAAALLALRYNF